MQKSTIYNWHFTINSGTIICAKVHSENQWIWIAKYTFFKQCMCNNHNLIICTLLKFVFRNSMLTYIFVNMLFFEQIVYHCAWENTFEKNMLTKLLLSILPWMIYSYGAFLFYPYTDSRITHAGSTKTNPMFNVRVLYLFNLMLMWKRKIILFAKKIFHPQVL